MRVCGAIAVVVLHAAAGGVVRFGSISNADWWTYNILDSACRWAVPVFLMLSGAVLLSPRDSEPLREFYAKRLARVGYPLLFWSVLYLLYANRGFSPTRAMSNAAAAVAVGTPYYHLYFLFVLLGLYLFVPVFRVVTQHLSQKRLLVFAALSLTVASGDSLMHTFGEERPNALSLFVPYIGYFFLGFALRDMTLLPAKERVCGLLAAVSLALTAGGTGLIVYQWGITRWGLFLYSPFSPTVIGMSACLFLLFVTAASRPQNFSRFSNARLSALGGSTLGIYLLHPLILDLLQKRGFVAASFAPPVYLTVAILVPLVVSLLFTLLLQRLGPLKRLTG